MEGRKHKGEGGGWVMKASNGEKDSIVYSRDIVGGISDRRGGERVKGRSKMKMVLKEGRSRNAQFKGVQVDQANVRGEIFFAGKDNSL